MLREMGADRKRSNVLSLRSRGIVIGPIDEDAKNSVWATSIGIACSTDMFRPTMYDRNMENGNRIPNINAPGLM